MNPCKCGSYAINDDPAGKLCDRCWRDTRLASAEAEIARLKAELDACGYTRKIDAMRDLLYDALQVLTPTNVATLEAWGERKRLAQELPGRIRAALSSRPCGYGPGDCSGVCSVCGNNPENEGPRP